MRRAPALTVGAVIAALLLYVLAGELLQVWVGMHTDTWGERRDFGRAGDEAEWQRVRNALDGATAIWPWKTSLQIDRARVALFGVYGGFVPDAEAGVQVLAAIAQAKAQRMADGELLVLEVRGHVLANDVAGARDAVQRLMRAAPHARLYWRSLVNFVCEYALGEPAFQPLARDMVAYYGRWDAQELERIAKQRASVRAFIATE